MSYQIQVLSDVAGTAFGGSPVWTDLSSYALAGQGFNAITVTWGRQDQLSDVSPTAVGRTLRNTDGRFTPGLASGAYYPNWRRRLHSQVRVQFPAVGGVVSNPSLATPVVQQASEAAITSGTFTVSAGQMLMVFCSFFSSTSTGVLPSLSISDTLGGLSWTTTPVTFMTGGFPGSAAIFTATATGSSGHVTVTPSATGATNSGTLLAVYSVSGASGVGVTGTNHSSGTVTLSGSPAASSLVAGLLMNTGFSNPGNTAPTGYTGLVTSTLTGAQNWSTIAYRNGGASSGLTFGGTISGNSIAVAVELLAAPLTVYLADDYADSLTVVPGKDVPTVTQVDGTDILGRFGGTPSSNDSGAGIVGTALRSFLAEEILLDNPTSLYMLQEQEGATTFADATGNLGVATIVGSAGTVDAGQTADGAYVAGSVVAITNTDWLTYNGGPTRGLYLSIPYPSGATAIRGAEIWFMAPEQAQPNGQSSGLFSSGGLDFFIGSDGSINVSGVTAPAGTVPYDGKMHQVARAGGNVIFDGVVVGTSATIPLAAGPIAIGTVMNGGPQWPYTGAIAYVATYGAAVADARIIQHYLAGSTALAGERTDTRISRLVSYRTNAGTVLDTGLGYMGQQDIQGASLQQALFDVAAVEGGTVFADGQGQINFRSRSRLFNPTPVLTLDCNTGCVDWPSQFREDTQNVVNDLTVTRNGGADNRYVNAASVAKDGEFSNTLTLDIDSDANALNMAGWIVANGVQSQITVTPLQVDLLQLGSLNPSLAAAVMQLKPLDCIQVTNAPSWAPASTMTCLVQGGELSLAVDAATASLNTSPLPPAVGVWDTATWDSASVVWAP